MRKLAPMFITTSILALAAGNVLANDMSSTDKTGSPTVSTNTNKQPLSYSDKSNTAKGSNAPMKDSASMGMSTSDKVKSDSLNSNTTFATDEDKADVKEQSNRKESTTDEVAPKHHKVKKAKTAHHAKMHKDTVAKDDTVTNTDTEKSMKNPPLSATKAEAANSTTGKSAGQ